MTDLLIFIHSLHGGGAERVAANLANRWAEQGRRVTLVTLTGVENDSYRLHPSVQRMGLNIASGSQHPMSAVINNVRRALVLRRVLRSIKPEVALAMMSTANVLLALAGIGLTGTLLIGSERIYPPRLALGRMWGFLRTHLYKRLDAVVALTVESAVWLQENTNASRVPVIPNPVSWPLPGQGSRLSVALDDDQCMLLAVGRLSEQKGFDHLIAVFRKLAADFPHWRLVILGEGPERIALQRQVKSAGLEHSILLPGRAGNVGQWYAAAALYVMSSRFEGFPNTLIEAMAHGVPAVSFDCDTGPRDIIRDGVDGLLVPAGDQAALEVALRRLMGDSALRLQFSGRAAEVRERFSMTRVAAMWDALFRDLRHGT